MAVVSARAPNVRCAVELSPSMLCMAPALAPEAAGGAAAQSTPLTFVNPTTLRPLSDRHVRAHGEVTALAGAAVGRQRRLYVATRICVAEDGAEDSGESTVEVELHVLPDACHSDAMMEVPGFQQSLESGDGCPGGLSGVESMVALGGWLYLIARSREERQVSLFLVNLSTHRVHRPRLEPSRLPDAGCHLVAAAGAVWLAGPPLARLSLSAPDLDSDDSTPTVSILPIPHMRSGSVDTGAPSGVGMACALPWRGASGADWEAWARVAGRVPSLQGGFELSALRKAMEGAAAHGASSSSDTDDGGGSSSGSSSGSGSEDDSSSSSSDSGEESGGEGSSSVSGSASSSSSSSSSNSSFSSSGDSVAKARRARVRALRAAPKHARTAFGLYARGVRRQLRHRGLPTESRTLLAARQETAGDSLPPALEAQGGYDGDVEGAEGGALGPTLEGGRGRAGAACAVHRDGSLTMAPLDGSTGMSVLPSGTLRGARCAARLGSELFVFGE